MNLTYRGGVAGYRGEFWKLAVLDSLPMSHKFVSKISWVGIKITHSSF